MRAALSSPAAIAIAASAAGGRRGNGPQCRKLRRSGQNGHSAAALWLPLARQMAPLFRRNKIRVCGPWLFVYNSTEYVRSRKGSLFFLAEYVGKGPEASRFPSGRRENHRQRDAVIDPSTGERSSASSIEKDLKVSTNQHCSMSGTGLALRPSRGSFFISISQVPLRQ
jgi:hypothetical protein